MKRVLLAAGIFLLSFTSQADCSSSGLYFWPETATINQNPIFIIEGYARSQAVIEGLNKKHEVYLQCGEKKVPLTIREICKGQFHLTQAILVPSENLEAGKEYLLVIDNLPETELTGRWVSSSQKREPVKWTVVEGADNIAPAWVSTPSDPEKSYTPYGCGPAESVTFKLQASDESSVFVKTTVTSKDDGTSTTYYLNVTGSTTLGIGHSMCSGAFIFSAGNKYEAAFELVDGSGNTLPWTAANVEFTAPGSLDFKTE